MLSILFFGGLILSSCKKDKSAPEGSNKSVLSASLNGIQYSVAESGLSGKIFSASGDAVKAIEVDASLDDNVKSFHFL